jgi:lipoate-protein ligase A
MVAGSVLESYSRISSGLLAALEQLSLAARADRQYELPAGASPTGPICFEVPSKYEITVQGKKLIGSAQARRKNGVLQHGTLPLSGDLSRITQVLTVTDEAARRADAQRLLDHAATVETILGYPVAWDQAAQAVIDAFTRTFDLEFSCEPLSSEETQKASQLQEEKYAHSSWTYRM